MSSQRRKDRASHNNVNKMSKETESCNIAKESSAEQRETVE